MKEIPDVLRNQARAIFSGDDKEHPPCDDCGGVHARACPRIHKIRLKIDEKGIVTEREAEYWPNGHWEANVIFWDDINDDDDEEAGNGDPAGDAVAPVFGSDMVGNRLREEDPR